MSVMNSAGFGFALTAAAVGLLIAASIVAETAGRRRTVRWLAGTGIMLSGVTLAVVAVRFSVVLVR